MEKQKEGFTLIELIVVIAIFGILATVTLAFLSRPGKEASDASVKANLLSIRKQSEIYYISNSNYGANITDCNSGLFSDLVVTKAINEIEKNIGGNANVTCTTSVGGNTWAISVDSLKKAGTTWCIDSTGNSKANSTSVSGLCN